MDYYEAFEAVLRLIRIKMLYDALIKAELLALPFYQFLLELLLKAIDFHHNTEALPKILRVILALI